MGWAVSWVAVKATKEMVLEALDARETDERVLPGEQGAELCAAMLPTGWCLVFSEDFDWGSRERVIELSRVGEAVGCQTVDKSENWSLASAARDGVELWRLCYNGPKHKLDVEGDLPEAFEPLKAQAEHDLQTEPDVDYMADVPIDLVKSVCGYRGLDDDSHLVFLALSRNGVPDLFAQPRTGWLRKLFASLGRRRSQAG